MRPSDPQKLHVYLQRWCVARPFGWQYLDAQTIAKQLLDDTAFADIKFAKWLATQSGTTVSDVVQSALPYPYNAVAGVMTEAIEIAATKRTEGQILKTLAIGVLAGLALVLLSQNS